jgi:hypothetical protein
MKKILNAFKSFSNTNKFYSTKMEPKINYGGNFESIVTKSTIFVDKSLFIKEAIENPAEVTLITMPRRWGKSANIDMLKRFLSIDDDTDNLNQKIFQQKIKTLPDGTKSRLKISEENILEKDKEKIGQYKEINALKLQGKYPVISIDFKDCKGDSVTEVKRLVNKKIIALFEKYGYLGQSTNIYSDRTTIGIKYRELLEEIKKGDFKNGIKDLSKVLSKHHEEKVWILIDEYDAAANKAYREFNDIDKAQKVADLFRDIFEPAFKNNPYLEKGLITGVQYIVKSGMLSGLNNLKKYNITDSKFSQYYGINEAEMDLLLEHFSIPDNRREQIKNWYNGYKEKVPYSQEYIDKYNIWSIVNYLNDQESGFKSYWEQSGDISFLKALFKKEEIKEKIESLIDEKPLTFKLETDFSIDNFKTLKEIINLGDHQEINDFGIDVLFSYLFITGYLTSNSYNEYKLPNQEIRYEMEKKVIQYYQTLYRLDFSKLKSLTDTIQEIINYDREDKGSFIKNKLKNEFATKFNELIKECNFVGQKDVNTEKGIFANENAAHSILNYISMQIKHAFVASEIYTKKIGSEDKGRADTVVKNKNTGLIIEVKHKGNAEKALKQAQDYKKLIETCSDQIYLGLNITDNKEITLAGQINIDGQETGFSWPDSE